MPIFTYVYRDAIHCELLIAGCCMLSGREENTEWSLESPTEENSLHQEKPVIWLLVILCGQYMSAPNSYKTMQFMEYIELVWKQKAQMVQNNL